MIDKISYDLKELVEISNISKNYGKKNVINSIDFVINNGDKIYLSGINGSGKTTLLKIIAGIILPSKGKVLFDKKTLFQSPELRKNIGYMTTEIMFYETLTVKDNLKMFAALFNLEDINKTVNRTIERFELTSYQDCLISEISSGMKRKFQIAAATINSPKLLILDEPFNTLDEETIFKIIEILRNYTVIFSTHDKFIAKKLANRELNLHNGQIREVTYE
ncbi:ABC transporter ATP-binding protein [Clostridium perfringens]|uniref:ABC transporter ATP-binding protein n=1 Tax=Clostridium perfringens TaxID=1502 RepID=UPI0022477F75|nr:ABC transporter ATP-binding protein [Clostridium perfringens]MCX0361813.1 ABC transporter ATP-binding protein [Clostridium perfringens]